LQVPVLIGVTICLAMRARTSSRLGRLAPALEEVEVPAE
jgi:hypothetical protein